MARMTRHEQLFRYAFDAGHRLARCHRRLDRGDELLSADHGDREVMQAIMLDLHADALVFQRVLESAARMKMPDHLQGQLGCAITKANEMRRLLNDRIKLLDLDADIRRKHPTT